jgi:hypothetical protein
MLQSLILIDVLSSACWKKGKNNNKKGETAGGLFSQGRTHFAGCAMQDFHSY